MATDRVMMGGVTSGILPGTLVDRIVEFVWGALAEWRDHPQRPKSESEVPLNVQLCKYLNVRARETFPMIAFNHEEPQGRRHSADLSVTNATSPADIYQPILVIEGKRLPAPSADREREYLTGHSKRSGGVQRFKLALHGASQSRGMIVAYLQKESARTWFKRLNKWIGELSAATSNDCDAWAHDELLRNFVAHANKTARCDSDHARTTGGRVQLHHAWVEMSRRHRGKPHGAKKRAK